LPQLLGGSISGVGFINVWKPSSVANIDRCKYARALVAVRDQAHELHDGGSATLTLVGIPD
jgi:hypothetical protein